jgi:hypothetical protein
MALPVYTDPNAQQGVYDPQGLDYQQFYLSEALRRQRAMQQKAESDAYQPLGGSYQGTARYQHYVPDVGGAVMRGLNAYASAKGTGAAQNAFDTQAAARAKAGRDEFERQMAAVQAAGGQQQSQMPGQPTGVGLKAPGSALPLTMGTLDPKAPGDSASSAAESPMSLDDLIADETARINDQADAEPLQDTQDAESAQDVTPTPDATLVATGAEPDTDTSVAADVDMSAPSPTPTLTSQVQSTSISGAGQPAFTPKEEALLRMAYALPQTRAALMNVLSTEMANREKANLRGQSPWQVAGPNTVYNKVTGEFRFASDIAKEQAAIKQQTEAAKAEARTKGQVTVQELRDKNAKERAQIAANAKQHGGMLDYDSARLLARQRIQGDSQAFVGWGRDPAGHALLIKALRDELTAQGIPEAKQGEFLANATTEFAGKKAGQVTLGHRAGAVELGIETAKDIYPLVIAASNDLKRTNIKSLNDLENWARSKTSSPELRRLQSGLMGFVNTYAKAIGGGVIHVADQNHAREVLDTGMSRGDLQASLDTLMKELAAEQRAVPRARAKLSGRDEAGHGPAPAPAAPGGGGKVYRYDSKGNEIQ